MEEEISIKVNIEDRFYPLRIPSHEEELVRKTAKDINNKSKFYRENYGVQDKQDALAMVALEFGTEKANLSDSTEEIQSQVEQLITEIEKKLV